MPREREGTTSMTLVITLHLPLDQQMVTAIEHLLEKAKGEVIGLHSDSQESLPRKARALAVAERHFYLQKHWGG